MRMQISMQRVVAETLIIVSSILIAFSIDAWWDDRQESIQRNELVKALLLEFEFNRERLTEEIKLFESLIARINQFLVLSGDADAAPLQDLKKSIGAAFTGPMFQPSLSTYESAVSTGSLRLIRNPALNQAITQFHEALQTYQRLADISAEVYFHGNLWELRRELGTLRVLSRNRNEYPSRFHLSEVELRNLFASSFVYAAVSTQGNLDENLVGRLRDMEGATNNIIGELEKLLIGNTPVE